MTNYFITCHTADQCKSRYYDLAKTLHPDKVGGSEAAFKAMQAEYEARLLELQTAAKNAHKTAEYQKLATQLIEILKVTKPEYYALIQCAALSPAVSAITTLLNGYFPKQSQKVNEFLKILQ
jgi:negative regulator of replication initiation